jgi:hypothetical protein
VQLRPRQGRRLHARGLAALSHTRGGRVSTLNEFAIYDARCSIYEKLGLEMNSRWQAPSGLGEVAAPRSAR